VETAASRRAALVGVTIMSFASTFMLSGVNIGLPAIGQEFSASALLLTWTSTVYSLAMAVLLLPGGKLADIYGRKRLYMIGVAIYAVSSLLCALATSAPMLLALRIPQGFGRPANGDACWASTRPPCISAFRRDPFWEG